MNGVGLLVIQMDLALVMISFEIAARSLCMTGISLMGEIGITRCVTCSVIVILHARIGDIFDDQMTCHVATLQWPLQDP